MNNKIYLLLVLLLAACGGAYTVTVPTVQVSVSPIDINVNATISYGDLITGFKVECTAELGPSASTQDVSNCADLKLSTLLEDIGSAIPHQ